jgi:hypothetical protein
MNSLTIRIEQGSESKYRIVLLDGLPLTERARVFAENPAPAINVKTLREQVLNKSGDPAAIGEKLGRFLLAGRVGDEWEERTRKAPSRTYLDVRPPELDGVPWEFARRNATLFLKVDLPFVQFRRAPPRDIAAEWEIRVLLVVAAKDENHEIGIRDEITTIRSAIRLVNRIIDVDTLRWPSRDALKERIEIYRPHILHIMGHGDNQGLQLYSAAGIIPWGAVEIDADLASWKWKPELVYLDTCRSAAGSSGLSQQTAQWSVAGRFLHGGCSAVIAMHADVRGSLAGVGAAAFYAALADGATLDIALAAGRLAIAHRAPGGQNAFDPYLPRLVVTRPVEAIVRHLSEVKIDECPDVTAALKTFVDRDDERRQLLSLLASGTRAVVVTGDSEIGKSWLLQWCMDAWLRRRMEVRYVEIAGCITWLDVLCAIRDRNSKKTGSMHQGLSAEARALLNWRLNALAGGSADPNPDSFTGSEQENAGWTKALVDPQSAAIDAHIKAMDALQAALLREAGNRDLVLVLDNFGGGDIGLASPYFAVLRDHWINNLVVRGPSRIRVVVGVNPRQQKEYGLGLLPDGFEFVYLKEFASSNFIDLMLELLPLTYGHEFGEKRDKVLAGLRKDLAEYDPEIAQFTGRTLSEQCETIWKFCRGKKKQWERA